MHIEVSRSVDAPAETVWAVLTDIPASALTIGGIVSVEPLTPGPYAPGYRWRETRRRLGTSSTEEMTAIVVDAPRSTTIVAENGGTEYRWAYRVIPNDTGCELVVTHTAETTHAPAAAHVVTALFGGVAERSARKALERDLADIAAAARARNPGPGKP